MRDSGIYLITVRRPNDLPLYYVGQSKNINKRFGQHKSALRNNRHRNKRLQYAFNKYGAETILFDVLETCDVSDLDNYEFWWLSQSVGFDRVCNVGIHPAAPMRCVKFSDDHCKKISAAISGENHYSRRRGPMPQEHRDAISRGVSGKTRSAESRARYSTATLGSKNPMFGMSGLLSARAQSVRGTSVSTGEVIEFDSMNLAESEGFRQEQISKCCSGTIKTHGGYRWERVTRPASLLP